MYEMETIKLVIGIVVVVMIIRNFVSILEDNKKEIKEEMKEYINKKYEESKDKYHTHELKVNADYLKLADNVLEVKPYYENTSSINAKVADNEKVMTALKIVVDRCNTQVDKFEEDIKTKEQQDLNNRLDIDNEEPPFIS